MMVQSMRISLDWLHNSHPSYYCVIRLWTVSSCIQIERTGPNQHTLTNFYSFHTRKMGNQRCTSYHILMVATIKDRIFLSCRAMYIGTNIIWRWNQQISLTYWALPTIWATSMCNDISYNHLPSYTTHTEHSTAQRPSVKLTTNSPSTVVRHECM